MRELASIVLDGALIGASCAYAIWLDTHKDAEPDYTWAEVGLGVGYTLAHAVAQGALAGGDWKAQAWRTMRSFVLSSPPIIAGELRQARENAARRRRYEAQRQ